MIGLLSIFCSSFVIALSGAMMPGPLLTVTISESSRRGALAGPLLIFGHGLLELALITALLLGLGPWLERDAVFTVVALTGGVTLAWMAFSMARSLPSMSLSIKPQDRQASNLVLAGILFSLVNPYWLLWWASIGLGYIMGSIHHGLAGVVAFFSRHILADLAWYTLISCGVAKGRHYLTDNIYRAILAVCAFFLLLFAIYFLWNGASRLRVCQEISWPILRSDLG